MSNQQGNVLKISIIKPIYIGGICWDSLVFSLKQNLNAQHEE